MANPRKFSEKIALHNQKMQEETAAFEKIMREVSDATFSNVNVNATSFKVDDPAEQIQQTMDSEYNKKAGQILNRESRGRSIGVGGPIRSRPSSRNIDTSPYGGTCVYLSPPNDSSWRRTNSDSAIHKTYNQQNQDSLYYNDLHSTHSLSVNSVAQREATKNYNRVDGAKQTYNLLDIRSRSATGIPCMPGINVYPSPHDKTLQVQIGNNTGSLPDLSSVHFPVPLPNTNGQEGQHDNNRIVQLNEMNSYTSNSSYLPPTGAIDKHLSSDYIVSTMNTDIKSPKDSSSQYATCNAQQILQNSYSPLYQSDHTIQKNKLELDDLSNVSHHESSENLIQHSMVGGIRSPHRSSAGSSPRLATSFPTNSKYFASAPNSPTSTIISNGETYEQKSDGYYDNQSIHHHFEQFTLVDPNDHIGQGNNLNNYNNQFQSISYIPDNIGIDGNGTKNVDTVILSDTMCLSQLYDNQRCEDLSRDYSPPHQLSNVLKKSCVTSTNIPEIILTDFSTGLSDYGKGESVRSIDLELGQMDFAGLQMLSDPNASMITDPTIEDSFRRDIH